MELIAIIIGESSKLITVKKKGGLYFPKLREILNTQYGFMKYPDTLEEFDIIKGITFSHGKFKNDKAIQTLILQENAIVASGQLNTIEVEEFIDEVMNIFNENFGYVFEKSRLTHYLSRLEIHSDVDLLPTVEHQFVAERLNQNSNLKDGNLGDFTSTGMRIDCEILEHSTLRPYSFILLRKPNRPHSENIYHSDAPLPTDDHLDLLKSYEDYRISKK